MYIFTGMYIVKHVHIHLVFLVVKLLGTNHTKRHEENERIFLAVNTRIL